MITAPPNRCRYFAFSPEMARWGLGVTAAGRAEIPAGASYPAGAHPQDHRLDWELGRTLDALQIVLITRGAGWLETHATGPRRIEAGMVFLLLPQRWHRYRPDPSAGWNESWVELRGPVVDSLIGSEAFPEASVLLPGAIAEGIAEQLDTLHHALLADDPPAPPPARIAAMGLALLASCAALLEQHPSSSPSQRAVRRAAAILAANHSQPPPLPTLARSLGMAYSPFRRAFKNATGLPPWQYVIHVRLNHARRLLASSHATLDEIASKVGFSSAFHLSNAFKKAHGIAPAHWRAQLQAPPPPGPT